MIEYLLALIIATVITIIILLVYYYYIGWTSFTVPMGGNISETGITVPVNKSVMFKQVSLQTNTKQSYDVTGPMNALAYGIPSGGVLALASPLSLTSFSVNLPDDVTSVNIVGKMKFS